MINNDNINKSLFEKLSQVTTVEQVENLFTESGVSDFLERANLLLEFQGGHTNASTNYASLDPKEIYRFELAIFLRGAWKKAKAYIDTSLTS